MLKIVGVTNVYLLSATDMNDGVNAFETMVVEVAGKPTVAVHLFFRVEDGEAARQEVERLVERKTSEPCYRYLDLPIHHYVHRINRARIENGEMILSIRSEGGIHYPDDVLDFGVGPSFVTSYDTRWWSKKGEEG